MKNIFLVNYRVKGIKTLEEEVSLSFYKKTITMPIDTKGYNIKGIYGINGSGKSGIIASVDILKNLIINEDYLNNPMVQKNLDAIVNKKTKELYIGVEFLARTGGKALLYNYEIILKKDVVDKFVIEKEVFSYKLATSRKDEFTCLLEVSKGKIISINTDNEAFKEVIIQKTANLLSKSTVSALFFKQSFSRIKNITEWFLSEKLWELISWGISIDIYIDQTDNHADYLLNDMIKNSIESEDSSDADSLRKSALRMTRYQNDVLSYDTSLVLKEAYEEYEKTVNKLKKFIQIFKSDLTDIEIDRKENGKYYSCSLNIVYGDYTINAEFESTGIKKLIKLFVYLQNMVQGGIVFIDEFDSNLHDVYLCALLEYLMEYGEGQLCFTTHNVGPMDVLKRNKKSIDFLSIDHKIYPWTTNGNYSPSKLYRNGMIEGSPFNVDSIDFIGVFDKIRDDDVTG